MGSDRTTVPAAYAWGSNAELIDDVHRLGWLSDTDTVLDCTHGEGTFWRVWRPPLLCATDLDPAKSPHAPAGVDFTAMPFADRSFDVVVFDPPYKLNGTPSGPDARYGVDVVASWQDRHALIRAGIDEACRVARRVVLLKCQDQVCSGRVRWQTREFADHAEGHGWRLADRFDLLGTSRPQPGWRRQVHAHGRPSSLLVFVRDRRSAPPQLDLGGQP